MKQFSVILLILLISIGFTQAQYKSGSGLLIFNAGLTMASPEDIEADLEGNTFSLSYEQSDFDGMWSFGFTIAYSKTSADSLTAGGNAVNRLNKVSYEVIPVAFYGKVNFGSEKFRGYAGAGLGVQFSNINYFAQNAQVTAYESGILISGLAGASFYLSESVLLNANYSINYLENSYYRDGLAHNINLGIGFQFD
jgi:outer membrane protein W